MIHRIFCSVSVEEIFLFFFSLIKHILFDDLGGSLITIMTRSWITSLSMILMISICYSVERARKYFWLYHLFGWGVPILTMVVIYFTSKSEVSSNQSVLKAQYFQRIETVVFMCVLILCVVISSANLLRIIRRRYKVKHQTNDCRRDSFSVNEIRPLINNDDEINSSTRDIPITCQSILLTQLTRFQLYICRKYIIRWQSSITSSCSTGRCFEYQCFDCMCFVLCLFRVEK